MRFIPVFVAACLAGSVGSAHGGLVTFEWQATVTDNGGFAGVSAGAAISGQYTFDLNTPDVQPTPETGIYDSAVNDWNAGFGGSSWSGDDMDIAIVDWNFDQYWVGNAGTALNGPDLDGYSFSGFVLQLRVDDTSTGNANAVTSVDLSATTPTLSEFETREVFFHFSDGNGNSRVVVGSLDQLSANSAVPEPSSLALLGMGGLTLLGYGRRRSRSRQQLPPQSVG